MNLLRLTGIARNDESVFANRQMHATGEEEDLHSIATSNNVIVVYIYGNIKMAKKRENNLERMIN